jgi:hypothetical protein
MSKIYFKEGILHVKGFVGNGARGLMGAKSMPVRIALFGLTGAGTGLGSAALTSGLLTIAGMLRGLGVCGLSLSSELKLAAV